MFVLTGVALAREVEPQRFVKRVLHLNHRQVCPLLMHPREARS